MILEVKNLKKNFGGIKALDKCSLTIKKNTITAIIGPNGSGKSTLFNSISNLISKDKGTIKLDNKPIGDLPDFEIARKGIARTFQEVRLFHNLSIEDHMSIALSDADEECCKSMIQKPKDESKRIKGILDLVQLHKPLTTCATNLSYGQRKLLDLAIAIAKPHHVLMLDEPVAGINPALRKIIKSILKKLHKKGETIILIEHDMNFVMDIADSIFVMDEGKIIAAGKPKAIQKNKKVLDAYLGD